MSSYVLDGGDTYFPGLYPNIAGRISSSRLAEKTVSSMSLALRLVKGVTEA